MGLCEKLGRRKTTSRLDVNNTQLNRCLNTTDLTALGVGSTLGAGAYVLAGVVAKTQAGPAIVLSFLIAALTSVMAGMCYAEFAARIPLAGSAYTYTYCSVGELCAFVIGWNLLLEYVIGTAGVARTLSGYFDSLLGGILIPFMKTHFPIHIPSLGSYADVLAFGFIMIFTVILAAGVRESAELTKLFTVLNMAVLAFICVAGSFYVDVGNWSRTVANLRNETMCAGESVIEREENCCERVGGCGTGGFLPFGIDGVLAASATCFFAFVGFDVIATTGEEAKDASRAIPVSILLTLAICCVFYVSTAAILTLTTPYFSLHSRSPFVDTFVRMGWPLAAHIVSVGSVFALSTSLLAGMFPMPRIVYAMARDGLIFRVFSYVNNFLKTPVLATFTTGTFAGIMALLFDVGDLIEMMSIGTLLAYTLVAISVLLLRYESTERTVSSTGSVEERITSDNVRSLVWITGIVVSVLAAVLTYFSLHDPLTLAVSLVLFVLVLVFLVLINQYPRSPQHLSFAVPLVPVLPMLSVFSNVCLMCRLRPITWFRFFIWLFVGLFVYLFYGVWHSSEQSNVDFEPTVAEHLLAQFSNLSSDSDSDTAESDAKLVESDV